MLRTFGFAALLSLAATGSTEAAQRLVSLDLCMDWLIAHHVPATQVAALSPMSKRYPIDWISQDWPSHDGSLEQIYQLAPDQVVVGEYAAALLRQRLQRLGIAVEVLPLPHTLADVLLYEQHFLTAAGLEKSPSAHAPHIAELAADAPRLLLLGANGIGTGSATLEDEIIRAAGWRNYLTADGYQALDLEQIALNPPDAILWAAPDHPALANQFANHPALKNLTIRWLTTDYWRWQCPGPWTWDLIGQLRAWHD